MKALLIRHGCLIPNRGLFEDVVLRDGPADSRSFTPFRGLSKELGKQLPNLNETAGIIALMNKKAEYNIHISRPTDEDPKERGSYKDVEHYQKRLEDANEEYVLKHVIEQIIGFKRDAKGGEREYKQTHGQVTRMVLDKESGEMSQEEDLANYQESVDIEDFQKARAILNCNLKMMHMGSIKMGGSLLSLAIAQERAERKRTDGNEAKPKGIIDEGVYRMKYDGSGIDLDYPFVYDDNKKPIFRELRALLRGENPGDVYYRSYVKFLKALEFLDIDIAELNIVDYADIDFRNLHIDYIETNEEFFSSYKDIEELIRRGLDPDKVASASIKSYAESLRTDSLEEKVLKSDESFSAVKVELAVMRDEMNEYTTSTPEAKRYAITDEFLKEFTRRFSGSKRPIGCRDFPHVDGIIHRQGVPGPLKIPEMPSCGFTKKTGDMIMLTSFGIAFKYKEGEAEINELYYTHTSSLLDHIRKGRDYEWRQRSLL